MDPDLAQDPAPEPDPAPDPDPSPDQTPLFRDFSLYIFSYKLPKGTFSSVLKI